MKYGPISLGLALLAGCARFEPQPISPGKSAAQLEARGLADAGVEKFLEQNSSGKIENWPKKNWNLEELTLAAFYFHPSLQVARAQWLLASAGLRTAGARLNPSVSIAPGYDSQIPNNFSPWLVPVTFDWPVETAGKRGKRLAEAQEISESARWNFVATALQIRSGVRASLLDFKIAGRRVELLQDQFALERESVKLLQQRLDTGEISRPELTIGQIALNKTLLDLGAARSKQADTRSRLAEALGLSQAALDGAVFDFDFSSPEATPWTSADARAVALRSRADLLAALADYAASEAALRLEIAKQYPDLHLGPAYYWNSGSAGDSQWSLGLTLELPILGQNQGPIAEAEARRKLAAAKFVELQARVIGEIDRALEGFRVAREQWQVGHQLLDSEQRRQKSAQARLQLGAGDRLDWLNAQLESSGAALAQLENEAALQAAYGALETALQRPVVSVDAVIKKISTQDSNRSRP